MDVVTDPPQTSSQRSSFIRMYLPLGILFFLAQLFVTSGHLMSPDGEILFRTAESIAKRGSLAIHPIEYNEELDVLMVPAESTFLTVQGRGGEFYAQYLPLQSMLAAPLIWAADLTSPIFADAFHKNLPNTVMHPKIDAAASWRRGVVVMLFNPIIQTITALLLIRMIVFMFGFRDLAKKVGLLFVFTTMVWPHSRTFFTEPLAALFILIAFDQVMRWRMISLRSEDQKARLKHMAILGAALGLSIWVRADSPLLVLGMGIGLVLLGEFKRHRESAYAVTKGSFPILDYLVAGGIPLLSLLLLIGFNQWRFAENATLLGGGYGDAQEGVKFSTSFIVGLHGYLMSPGKSLLFFSPGIILGLWGWARAPKEFWWLKWFVLIAFFPFALGMIKWQNWAGGWCWGPRHILQLHAPIMLGTLFLFFKQRKLFHKIAFTAVISIGVCVQLFGSFQSPLDYFHELYRTPQDDEYYQLSYRPMETTDFQKRFRLVEINHNDNRLSVPVSPLLVPAPMTDSLYVPQHTQWNGYPRLAQLGYNDMYLLRILGFGNGDGDVSQVTVP